MQHRAHYSPQQLAEVAKAQAAIPAGYKEVLQGTVQAGDLVWDFVDEDWIEVTPPKPFVKGQKRPGWRQMSDVGEALSKFICVARKAGC